MRYAIASVLSVATLAAFTAPVSAGFYKTIDVLDGGFSDWDDVPVVATDSIGDGTPIDFHTIQIANNDTHLFLRITYATLVNPNAGPNTNLAFDVDNNVATGADIYGLGIVGSDAWFLSDAPYDQRTGWNVGSLSSNAGIAPYYTETTSQEYSIPRNLTFTSDSAPVFGSSFTVLAWSDWGSQTDATPGAFYTFASEAAVPEPAAMSLLALGGLVALRRRRAAC